MLRTRRVRTGRAAPDPRVAGVAIAVVEQLAIEHDDPTRSGQRLRSNDAMAPTGRRLRPRARTRERVAMADVFTVGGGQVAGPQRRRVQPVGEPLQVVGR